jgi:arylsulfatase A-like enzyme
VGESEYQNYDREITRRTIAWLEQEAADQATPWVLLVSYVSSHPPFLVPNRLYDLYPHDRIPLPVLSHPDEMPRHPALEYIRKLKLFRTMDDEAVLKRIAAGYFALLTHLDEQIGQVMAAVDVYFGRGQTILLK